MNQSPEKQKYYVMGLGWANLILPEYYSGKKGAFLLLLPHFFKFSFFTISNSRPIALKFSSIDLFGFPNLRVYSRGRSRYPTFTVPDYVEIWANRKPNFISRKTFKSLTDLKTEDIRPDSHSLGTRQLYECSSLF